MSNVDLDEILRLPVEERITLVQQIWDSVAADAEAVPITPEQQEELQRRLEEHERNPDDAVEWSEVRERLRSRFKEGRLSSVLSQNEMSKGPRSGMRDRGADWGMTS